MKQKRGIQKGIKKLVSMALAGALAFGTIGQSGLGMKTVEAAYEITINDVSFPDEAFRTAIAKIADTNNDGKLSLEEREAVTELKLNKENVDGVIYSVAGMAVFPNLRVLSLREQRIQSINLRGNRKLESLDLTMNRLESIDLIGNSLLTKVSLSNNRLSTLDVSFNKKIEILSCRGNQMTELLIGRNEVLRTLDCSDNQLSELIVNGDINLRELRCDKNNLTSLDLTELPSLWQLDCGYNQIESLDVSGLKGLSYLRCEYNKLGSGSLILEDGLYELKCEGNNLTSLNLDKCSSLARLYCSNNQLTELNLSKCEKISSLSCYGNQITSLDKEILNNIKEIEADLVLIHPAMGNSKIKGIGVYLPAVYQNGSYTYDISAFPYIWESMIGKMFYSRYEDGNAREISWFEDKNFTSSFPNGDTNLDYYDEENNKVSVTVYYRANLDAKLPSITKQPSSLTKTTGTASFSVQGVGDVIGYQWQEKAPGSTQWRFCKNEGSTAATMTFACSKALDGYEYRCAVINSKGMAAYSREVKYTYGTALKLVTQPQDITGSNLEKVQFKVSAVGDGLTYQWYWRKNATSEWGICGFTGNKTNAMTVEVIPARNGYQYRCTVKDRYGVQVDSKYATLHYNRPMAITKQPDSISAVSGTSVKFSVAATGDGLTYQWYWRRNADYDWGVCGFTGSKTNTMTVDAIAARNGFNYKCVVTDKYGTKAESKTAVLTVKTYANITAQPKSVLAKSGNVNFTVSAVGDGLTYQWYWRKNASSAWGVCGFTGCKTNNLTVEVISARNGYQYRCAVKDKYGHIVYSEPATLTYGSKVVITKQPVSIKAKAGTTAKFTVTATGDGLTYQWYWRKNASSEWGVCGFTGSKTNAMSVEAIIARNGYQYKCVVKDKYGNTVNSSVATFTVE